MFFLQFTITPRRSAEFGSDAGGAYVCCRIERPKLQDAVDVARSNIVQRGWIVDEPDEAYVVDGSNHPPGTAGRDYFEQALTDLRRRHGYWKGFAATLAIADSTLAKKSWPRPGCWRSYQLAASAMSASASARMITRWLID